jgi:hypothetical protein
VFQILCRVIGNEHQFTNHEPRQGPVQPDISHPSSWVGFLEKIKTDKIENYQILIPKLKITFKNIPYTIEK